MRFAGLSICLLVSTLSARAESLEERVVTLEHRIKSLEAELRTRDVASGLDQTVAAGVIEDIRAN
jgi:hypothetical protein